ncbi:YciI family protein [uncultured Sphingomonas sp.]|uniref:YciI family protein n=1 Tax=uncultured Sphingomonas sp. TaxID=158754 RepID=UPI0035CB49A9
MTTTAQDVKKLTEKSLMKRLFVALQYPVAPEATMMERIADHLRYMEEHEHQVFLSGPLIQDGVTIGEGLTILKTDDEAEARAIMDAEPLVKNGLRRYELKLWRIQEGSISVSISGVAGTATLG